MGLQQSTGYCGRGSHSPPQPRHTTHSSSLESTLQTRMRSGNPKEGLEDRIEESMHKTDQCQKNRRDHEIMLS